MGRDILSPNFNIGVMNKSQFIKKYGLECIQEGNSEREELYATSNKNVVLRCYGWDYSFSVACLGRTYVLMSYEGMDEYIQENSINV